MFFDVYICVLGPCRSTHSQQPTNTHPKHPKKVIDLAPLHIPQTLLTSTATDGSSSGSNGGGESRRVYVAELFHGPSLAFKDLGMQVRLCLVVFRGGVGVGIAHTQTN